MIGLIRLVAAIALGMCVIGASAADWQVRLAALEAAAEQGDPKAQTELGVKYENAEGIGKDLRAARLLYCRAAKRGYAEAQFRLGWMYANARGVPRDDDVAAALFRMAAEQGHEYAARLLGYMHESSDTQMPSCMLSTPVHPAFGDYEDVAGLRSEIVELVRRLAPRYAVDSQLALAVISAESDFNPAAISAKNAQGLMQLIPETAERFGVKKVFNPVENIKGGLAYLRWLLAFFQGDVPLVLAAYNAGERAVEKYHGIPPYPETRNYVKKITAVYKKRRHPYDSGVVDPSPIMRRIKAARG